MILPLSCHGTFPRALALIEWKLNLLTFFSACYSLVHGATVHKFSPNSDFQYLKEQTRACFHWHQCWDFYHHTWWMHNVAFRVQLLCLLDSVYCGKGFTHCQSHFFFHLLVFRLLYVALCGVFSVLRADEANNKCTKQVLFFSILLTALCCGQLFQLSR